MDQAVTRVRTWIEAGSGPCRFVVTPNVDHVVQLHRRPELLPLYNRASLSIADGWPLVSMSRVYRARLPERVPGSDLLPNLCQHYTQTGEPLRLFLLGGMPGVPERAAAAIHARWPSAQVTGHHSPPMGFEHDPKLNEQICDQINESRPDIVVVGLGFPKQETWLDRHAKLIEAPVGLAVGGTIDFLAGEQKRAPKWIQRIRMEWFHRMATNPRRLTKRYATGAVHFPCLCLKEFRSLRRAATGNSTKNEQPRTNPP